MPSLMSLPSIRELLPDAEFDRSVPRSPPATWSPLSPSQSSISLPPRQSAGPSALRPDPPPPTYPQYTYPPPPPLGAPPSFRLPPPDPRFYAPLSRSEPPIRHTRSFHAPSTTPSASAHRPPRPPPLDPGYVSTSPESLSLSLSEYDSDSSDAFSAVGPDRPRRPPTRTDAPSPDGDDDGSKRHQCPHCGKRFNRPSSLGIHINTHTGAKPFLCPYQGCGKSFNVNSNMRRHYRKHLVPPPPPGTAHYHPFPPAHPPPQPPLPPPRRPDDLHIIRYPDAVPRDLHSPSPAHSAHRRDDHWDGRARSYSWESYGSGGGGGGRPGRRA